MSVTIANSATSTAPWITKGSLLRGEPVEDRGAEGQRADRRADRRGADRDRHRDPDPGEDHRRGERQIDIAQELPGRQPHAARRPRAPRPAPFRARRSRSRRSAGGRRGTARRGSGAARSRAPGRQAPAPRPAGRSGRPSPACRTSGAEIAPGGPGHEDRQRDADRARRGARRRDDPGMRQPEREKAAAIEDRRGDAGEAPLEERRQLPASRTAARRTAPPTHKGGLAISSVAGASSPHQIGERDRCRSTPAAAVGDRQPVGMARDHRG